MRTNDIVVGMVVSFKGNKLRNDTSISELRPVHDQEVSHLPDETRPFICVGKKDGCSQWAELTTIESSSRFHIPAQARTWLDGDTNHNLDSRWKQAEQWVKDVVFQGPDDILVNFVTDTYTSNKFRCVEKETVEKIISYLASNLRDPLFPASP